MKKIFFAAVALVASMLLTTSCSNDDIVVETTNPRHTLTLNISPQGLYDKFEITSDIKNQFLREEGYGIGVFSYIYDSKGNLVDSKKSILNNFSMVSQTLPKLEDGSYTLITIETLVNTDIDNEPESWSIEDTGSLSTIKLKQYGYTYWAEVIGLATTQIKLDTDKEVNIAPGAIGSIINLYGFDFDKSEYIRVGFATDGLTDYYSLNPQLDRKARAHVDLTKAGYINVRMIAEVNENENYYSSIYVIEPEITWMNIVQDEDDMNEKLYSSWYYYDAELEDGEVYYNGFYYLNEDYIPSSTLGDLDNLISFVNYIRTWKEENLIKEVNAIYGRGFVTPKNQQISTVSEYKSYMPERYFPVQTMEKKSKLLK